MNLKLVADSFTLSSRMEFLNQIHELIQANGWESLLEVEVLYPAQDVTLVRVKLHQNHLSDPGAVVNVYTEGIHSLEQVQQECLRALRTGRPGI